MSLTKMTIVAYSDEKFSSKVDTYAVMLNPESLKWGRQIEYNVEQSIDSSAPSPKYNKTMGEQLSFELLIDCSGVVDSKRVDLPSEIDHLAKVVYDYNGKIHRPNYIIINWGKGLAFKCVLVKFDTSYTFFKPDGTAIRAKLSLEFSSYIDPVTKAKKDANESPDITHLVDIVEGDSLPQIAQNIYQSPDYYVQLAKFNGLNKFRNLTPGSQIIVPPLVADDSSGSSEMNDSRQGNGL